MQPTTLFRTFLACALAIGATGPVHSQRAPLAADPAARGRALPPAVVEDGADALRDAVDLREAPARAIDARGPVRAASRPERAPVRDAARARAAAAGRTAAGDAAAAVALEGRAVQRDFALLRSRWAVLVEARLLAAASGVPAAVPTPPALHRGHLERLSAAGELRATVYLSRHPELLLAGTAQREFRTGRYVPTADVQAAVAQVLARLVVQAGDVATLEALDVLGRVSSLYRAGWLAPAAAMAAFEAIELRTPGSALAPRARFLRAKLILSAGRGVAHLEGLAARLLSTLTTAQDPAIAAEAEALVWRLVHLRVGRPIPALCGNDAVGNELCVEDFRGRVVFLRFWSADDDDVHVQLVQDTQFVEHFWDHPFALIGVNRDADRAEYISRLDASGLPGNQIYDGPASEDLIAEVRQRRASRPKAFEAWREATSGSTYLIDSRGILRALDPEPAAVPALVRGLLDEYYAARRVAGR